MCINTSSLAVAQQDVVLRVAAGQDVGTLVDPAAAEAAGGSKAAATASSARDMAVRARAASRQLQVRGCVGHRVRAERVRARLLLEAVRGQGVRPAGSCRCEGGTVWVWPWPWSVGRARPAGKVRAGHPRVCASHRTMLSRTLARRVACAHSHAPARLFRRTWPFPDLVLSLPPLPFPGQAMTSEERCAALLRVADALVAAQEEIMQVRGRACALGTAVG